MTRNIGTHNLQVFETCFPKLLSRDSHPSHSTKGFLELSRLCSTNSKMELSTGNRFPEKHAGYGSSTASGSTLAINRKYSDQLDIDSRFFFKTIMKRGYHDLNNTESAREQEQAKNAEDVLFDMFKNEATGLLPIVKFLAALKSTGIRKSDPRIFEFMENLRDIHREGKHEGGAPETLRLDLPAFKRVVTPNIVLISKAFRHQFVIPDFPGFCKYIEGIHRKLKPLKDGEVAAYIPQLARMSPDNWGISFCTIDGQRYSVGDVKMAFTIQSCSKPLTYAIALDNLGEEVVHNYVGQEPSGRNFNELILDHNKQPHNPMINAGAILVCALLRSLVKPELTLAEKFDFVMNYFKRLAGHEYIGFNNAVFLSEREAADRNYALGFYMREHKCFPDNTNLKDVMDFYFQCCSMETNCESMAVIAATLANGGICPITEEKVMNSDSVRNVLSLMHSCGMYDYSGQFAFKVGIPAKSGVSGALLVVIPNVMGICTWSPPLDPLGNSCRGLAFCEELVREFNFHRYDNLKHAANKRDPRRHKFETRGLSIVNLLFSAASGDLAALRRHWLSGLDMTLSDYDGRTALHLVASEGHIDCVKFLVEQCRVPLDPKDRWGNTPKDEAKTFSHPDVVKFLEDTEKGDVSKADDEDEDDSGEVGSNSRLEKKLEGENREAKAKLERAVYVERKAKRVAEVGAEIEAEIAEMKRTAERESLFEHSHPEEESPKRLKPKEASAKAKENKIRNKVPSEEKKKVDKQEKGKKKTEDDNGNGDSSQGPVR